MIVNYKKDEIGMSSRNKLSILTCTEYSCLELMR